MLGVSSAGGGATPGALGASAGEAVVEPRREVGAVAMEASDSSLLERALAGAMGSTAGSTPRPTPAMPGVVCALRCLFGGALAGTAYDGGERLPGREPISATGTSVPLATEKRTRSSLIHSFGMGAHGSVGTVQPLR